MRIDGDLTVTRSQRIEGDLRVSGKLESEGARTLSVGSVLYLRGSVSVKEELAIEAATVTVGGNVSGPVKIGANVVTIYGDLRGEVAINAVTVNIAGNCNAGVVIKATNIHIEGEYIEGQVRGKLSTLGATKIRAMINGVALEVDDGDIGKDGIISKGTVKISGIEAAENCEKGIDLAKVGGEMGRIYSAPTTAASNVINPSRLQL